MGAVFYVWVVAGALLLVVIVMVALGRGDSATPVSGDRRSPSLPDDRAVSGDDLDELRLPQAVRGYRMADVDDVLDRVAADLRERDDRIAVLEDRLGITRDRPAKASDESAAQVAEPAPSQDSS